MFYINFVLEFYLNMYKLFWFIVYAFIVQNSPLISQVFDILSVLEFCLSLYVVIKFVCTYLFVYDCYSLYL